MGRDNTNCLQEGYGGERCWWWAWLWDLESHTRMLRAEAYLVKKAILQNQWRSYRAGKSSYQRGLIQREFADPAIASLEMFRSLLNLNSTLYTRVALILQFCTVYVLLISPLHIKSSLEHELVSPAQVASSQLTSPLFFFSLLVYSVIHKRRTIQKTVNLHVSRMRHSRSQYPVPTGISGDAY